LLSGYLVTDLVRPWVVGEDALHMRRVVANILNKPSLTADMRWSFSLKVGPGWGGGIFLPLKLAR